MIRFLTAGESHGKGLTAIVEGFPSNIPLKKEFIDIHLKRRQMGYGRGGRMKIESDSVELLSGVRFGKTLGSPVSMFIQNKDWENWTDKMSHEEIENEIEKITIPRPGHADLVGTLKYNFDDIRNSIERSSARETAARVAACTIARKFLEELGISIGSFVESIGNIYPDYNYSEKLFNNSFKEDAWALSVKADKSEVRVFNPEHEEKIKDRIRTAKKNGDTLGGTFYIVATGIPVGLGSFMHYDRRLDSEIANAIMSVNAVKGVEIGTGFKSAEAFGSESHDEIIKDEYGSLIRKTNRAGGIEGGISTGMPIIIRAAMKPIATLMSPIQTVDLSSMELIEARRERSDFVAVPACSVIGESMLAWVIADFILQKFGGDSLEEIIERFDSHVKNYSRNLKQKFASESD